MTIDDELRAYLRQSCCSRKPKSSRAFRLGIEASDPSISRAIGVGCLVRNSIAGSFAMISRPPAEVRVNKRLVNAPPHT